MNCPDCKHLLEVKNGKCANCGSDLSKYSWIVVSKVYPPSDIIIESLLKSCGIPVKIFRREIPQIPVNIGPLGEIEIAVPGHMLESALALLKNAE
ncbi:MAG: hypothetical protein H5T98_09115 [Syntrophomonadaceae bacterium]|nr:hypothetical protein [Syntrophomonadaceae bacterium]